MITFFGTIASILLINTASATDLGEALTLKIQSAGKPALGFVYSDASDPDGAYYIATFSANIPAPQAATSFKVNYYQPKTDAFLLPWTSAKDVFLSVMQVMESDPALVGSLIEGAKKTQNEVILLFSNDNGATISYHLSLSQSCALYPSTFHNLTTGLGCAE